MLDTNDESKLLRSEMFSRRHLNRSIAPQTPHVFAL
jgi:hypothetical protein